MTRKQVVTRGLTVALMLGTAACGSDRLAAPGDAPPDPRAARLTYSAQSDTVVASMVYHPGKGLNLKIGEQHQLFIPAHAVCDLEASGYGAETWELPCAPARRRMTVTAKAWVDSAGHPFVQFSPDLRFSPDDKKAAWLALADRFAARDSSARILYCPTAGGGCVDESLTDVEVVTHADWKKGYVYRRIKHLSGYNIVSGRTAVEAEAF